MPSEILIRVAKYTRDLLGVDEQLIRIGRQNFEREEFETDYIVIDALGPALRSGSLETYDGDAEQLSLGAIWKGPVTLDFYGDDAYTRAIDFSLRMRSQAARELRRALGISIYQVSGITDVKALTGQQYGERMQIAATVEISNQVTIDTLRIDEAQLEIRNEEGVQFDG